MLLDKYCVAIFKLASVVLGVPFPDRISRLAWCVRWGSLLLTWRVARGFVADTKMRPPRVQNMELHLSSDTELTSKDRAALMNEAHQLFEAEAHAGNLQGLGYRVLSTTAVKDRNLFEKALPLFKPYEA